MSVTALILALGLGSVAGQAKLTVPAGIIDKLSTGANVCRWFRFPAQTTAEHFAHYVSLAEMRQMRAMGIKHVRLCIAPVGIMDAKTGQIIEGKANSIDQAITKFHQADLLVVVDIHNEDRAVEGNPEWENNFVNFWSHYAKRLTKFKPSDTVFEIVNEPVYQGREDQWFALRPRLAAAIRQAAPRYTIIATGPNWGGIDGLVKLKPLNVPNVVYSFHCYDPFPFTHKGATWAGEGSKHTRDVPYPSTPENVATLLPRLKEENADAYNMVKSYGDERWNRAKMVERFSQAMAWGRAHNVPLYCGEFGVYPAFSKPEHRANWFHDFGSVLAENSVGWASWGWDEGFGFNRRWEGAKLVVDPVVTEALGLKLPK